MNSQYQSTDKFLNSFSQDQNSIIYNKKIKNPHQGAKKESNSIQIIAQLDYFECILD